MTRLTEQNFVTRAMSLHIVRQNMSVQPRNSEETREIYCGPAYCTNIFYVHFPETLVSKQFYLSIPLFFLCLTIIVQQLDYPWVFWNWLCMAFANIPVIFIFINFESSLACRRLNHAIIVLHFVSHGFSPGFLGFGPFTSNIRIPLLSSVLVTLHQLLSLVFKCRQACSHFINNNCSQ